MQLKNIETGLLRISYVAWVVSIGVGFLFLAEVIGNNSSFNFVEILGLIAGFSVFAFGPWVVIRLVRWIYRGFVPIE